VDRAVEKERQNSQQPQLRILSSARVEGSRVPGKWEMDTSKILRKFTSRLFPSGTRRRKILALFSRGISIVVNEGLSSLVKAVIQRYVRRRRAFHTLSLNEQYRIWLENNQLTGRIVAAMREEIAGFRRTPKISVAMPVREADGRWLETAVNSLIQQVYPNWELCLAVYTSVEKHVKRFLEEYQSKDLRLKVRNLGVGAGIATALNAAVSSATGEFVGLLYPNDELTSDALYEIAKLLNEHPDVDYIYTDEDQKDVNGRRVEPFFKPDWSPDLLLSMNYVSHFSVVRRSLLDEIGGFRMGFDGSEDYDLILRVAEKTNKVAHIAKPLSSRRMVPGSEATVGDESAKKALQDTLNRRGIKGEILDGYGQHYRTKYDLSGSPLVSIIIPTRDHLGLLKRCIDSIESKTTYREYEIIVMDNKSIEPQTLSYLRSLKHRVLRFNDDYNFSKMNNFAARHAKGDYLVFLNNDTEVIEPGWLEAMLEHSQRSEVGVVGALLLFPVSSHGSQGGTIQHAGVVIGICGVSGHAFRNLHMNRPNHFDLHRVTRNCSAVTFACAMMRKDVFEQFNGLDEDIPISFNDVDLCLRIRKKGYLIVFTPYAVLYHHECATRRRLHPPEDETSMLNRWSNSILEADPYYNPNLTLLREDFSLAPKCFNVRALTILLELYHSRLDLQRAYPEVMDGNYQRLIDWAAECGITIDGARYLLRPHHAWYVEKSSKKVKPVATILGLYNVDSHLQRLFPEVLRQDYRRLIAWASEIREADYQRNPALRCLLPHMSIYSAMACEGSLLRRSAHAIP
jgi:GT2 family glycosyltransferase